MTAAIQAEGLRKTFGDREVVQGIDLQVEHGSVVSVLGPNGAGKTTTVRMLATLLAPDAGRATVAGFDVATQAREVRRRIGLTGQFAAVDARLTGRENLELCGRLHKLRRTAAQARAAHLLDRFALTDAADKLARTYSGGMRRRLDLAASLVAEPSVVFLDEPTTGLDPASRIALWDMVRSLVRGGVGVLLTTQYLEEADQLADRVVVVDEGRVVAEGTPDELKRTLRGDQIDITLAPDAPLALVVEALTGLGTPPASVDTAARRLVVPVACGAAAIAATASAVRLAGADIVAFEVRRPTLDEVFLSLTGGDAADRAATELATVA